MRQMAGQQIGLVERSLPAWIVLSWWSGFPSKRRRPFELQDFPLRLTRLPPWLIERLVCRWDASRCSLSTSSKPRRGAPLDCPRHRSQTLQLPVIILLVLPYYFQAPQS